MINRVDRRSQLECLKQCGELLKQGASVLFFPEGTRTKDGRMHAFKKGAFSVAAKAKVGQGQGWHTGMLSSPATRKARAWSDIQPRPGAPAPVATPPAACRRPPGEGGRRGPAGRHCQTCSLCSLLLSNPTACPLPSACHRCPWCPSPWLAPATSCPTPASTCSTPARSRCARPRLCRSCQPGGGRLDRPASFSHLAAFSSPPSAMHASVCLQDASLLSGQHVRPHFPTRVPPCLGTPAPARLPPAGDHPPAGAARQRRRHGRCRVQGGGQLAAAPAGGATGRGGQGLSWRMPLGSPWPALLGSCCLGSQGPPLRGPCTCRTSKHNNANFWTSTASDREW